MSTASKYLIRQPPPPAAPERLREADALRRVIAATAGAACPHHEVGPIAAHLVGPVAALPPHGHPDSNDLTAQSWRSADALNAYVAEACGLRNKDETLCTCHDLSYHRLTITRRDISRTKVAVAHQNTAETQRRVDNAVHSGDVDLLLHAVEPRAWALTLLVDRARAENGGTVPEPVAEAAVVVARTLAGPTRWNVRDGYERYNWPPSLRIGVAFEKADSFCKNDYVFDLLVVRMLDGSR